MSKNEVKNSSCLHNTVATGSKITGDITAEEDIRIDGLIEGNVICKGEIIIGPSSVVTGNIQCSNIDLMGKVIGNIQCTETIVLKNTSSLTGDIEARAVEMEIGAAFSGKCSMIQLQN